MLTQASLSCLSLISFAVVKRFGAGRNDGHMHRVANKTNPTDSRPPGLLLLHNDRIEPSLNPPSSAAYFPRSFRNSLVYSRAVLPLTELQVEDAELLAPGHGVSRSSDQKCKPAKPLLTA